MKILKKYMLPLMLISMFVTTSCQNEVAEVAAVEETVASIKGIVATEDVASNYVVEVVEATTTDQKVGKSVVALKVTNRVDGSIATGLNITYLPHMAMLSGMNHNTPVDKITDNGDGTYTIILYYFMGSYDMMGAVAGAWTAKVQIAGDAVLDATTFTVAVTGSMMDRVVLKGVTDKINNMGTVENRLYFVFKEMVMGTNGNKTVKLFLATEEAMLSHPAVSATTSLKDESSSVWTVNSVSIEVYDGSSAWIQLTDDGNGHFSKTNVNISNMLHIRLKINNGSTIEQKTTNGLIPDAEIDPTVKTGDVFTSNGFGHLMLMAM